MNEMEYEFLMKDSKFASYQDKAGDGTDGIITIYLYEIWKWVLGFLSEGDDLLQLYVNWINYFIILERYCLERRFHKIRIKGGACTPCCIERMADCTISYLFDVKIDEDFRKYGFYYTEEDIRKRKEKLNKNKKPYNKNQKSISRYFK